ncbi:MAG: hypothetical protein GYA57_03860 [Myxococcales bacterium]|nr:hypothetical protein [Myxococcales bacterium]
MNDDGTVVCETDDDTATAYTAGPGLTLSGTQFAVSFAGTGTADTAARSDHTQAWSSLTGVPAGFADGTDDTGTSYTAGTGITISDTTISANQTTVEGWARGVCYDTTAELRGVLDPVYAAATHSHAWSTITSMPVGFSDGVDNDTTYSAGTGLALTGTTFSVATGGVTSAMIADGTVGSADINTGQVQVRVAGSCAAGNAIRAVNVDGTVACEATTAGARPVLAYSETGATTYLTTTCANYSGGQVSITVPAAGSIVVEANARMILNHVSGTEDELVLGIGTTTTDCGTPYDSVRWDIPSGWPTASSIYQTFTVRRRFAVSAGTYTYYLNGYMASGYAASTDLFWYANMTATFIPN